jgi:hypothetical protein
MSNEQPSRPKRSGSNASPMGSTLAIVIAIAAVVIGFLILNKIRGNDDKAAAPAASTTPTIDPSQTTIQLVASTVAAPPTTVFTTAGATVLVANSSTQNKVAKKLSTALESKGFVLAEPTDGADTIKDTLIQFKEGDAVAQAVATSVATTMGIDPATITVIPTPVKLADPATLGDATVVVLLGDDKAGKTFEQMTGAKSTTDTTPATGDTTAAPVST